MIRCHHCGLHVCHSETDDSSSLPVAERSEVSPAARKPSLHLTLPDFQDASAGLSCSCTSFYLTAAESHTRNINITHLMQNENNVQDIISNSLELFSAAWNQICSCVHRQHLASPHRFPEPVFGGGFSPGGGALRGVRLKLHPSPRTHVHLDHPGTHMAAGWYIKSPHTYQLFLHQAINQSIIDNIANQKVPVLPTSQLSQFRRGRVT